MTFDLTNASTNQDIYINATISSEGSCDIGYITVTNDTTAPEYNDSTNKYVYVSGSSTSRYKVPLTAGEINYVHFGYRKDGSVNNGNDAFTIESIIYYADSSPVPIYIGRNDIVDNEEISYVTPILNEEVDKVQVIRNITLTDPIEIVETRDVELDLNGYTITTSRSDYIIKNNGSLKIKDTKYTSDEAEAEEQYNREMEQYNIDKAKYDQDLIEYNEYLASPNSFIDNDYVLNYDYTKDVQELVIPETGVYKLETWGAQGGSSDYKTGGYGGYSVGEITLNKYDKLYIYVGGSGSCAWGSSSEGGYNGGGGSLSRNGSYALCSGGGATHIATEKGLLSTLSDKVSSILIVSGAGGGAGSYGTSGNNGASGGGYVGNSLYNGSTSTGGSQLNGGSGRAGNGSFGLGSGSTSSYSCGGGAGFYGGGSDAYEWGAAGGSGYIGNESLTNKKMVCLNCSPDSSVNTKTETTSNFSDEAKPEYAKAGNGYARITLIDEDAKARIEAEPRKEYTVTTLPEEPIKPEKQEVTLTGNITSTTDSVILNDYNSYLEIENGIVNLDKSGSLDIITNKGTLKLGSDALLNGLQANNRGINNTSSGDILDGSGTISMSSSNNIGILNNSFNDNSIKGYKLSNTSTNSYNIYNNSRNEVTYENITSTGSGIDIYQTGNENLIVKNSSLESTSNESYYSNETTEVSNVEFNNCTIKNRIFNRSNSARTILIKDSDLSGSRGNVYNYGGKVTINHSDLENSSYNIQNYTETDVISNSTLVSTDSNNSSINNSDKEYNTRSGTINISNSTITSSNIGIQNSKGTTTVSSSTINSPNNAVYNGSNYSNNLYQGTLVLDNTTINKTGDSDINVVYNYYGDININGGSINNESNDSTAIYNENKTNNTITIKGNYSNSNNFNKGIYNNSILTLGDNTDSVSKTYPNINATSSAIYNSDASTFNYYDGKLVGVIDNSLDGIVSDMPDAHDIYVTKGNSTEDIVLMTKIDLDVSEDYVAKIGASKYTTIQSAFDAVSNNNTETEVELLKDIETASIATIDSNKNIKLKYAGHFIKSYNSDKYFDNNGTFTLVDGNDVINNKVYTDTFINNKGIVNYDSAISMAIRTNKILNNNINSTFNMNGGELYSYESQLIDNSGSLNISNGKIYTTRTNYANSGNYNLIENEENGVISISGGDFEFIGKGSLINNKNIVTVSDANVDLYGYHYWQASWIYGFEYTTFINNSTNDSEATITGGTYGDNQVFGLLLRNAGTARIENVTSKFYGAVYNTGTVNLINDNMEYIYNYRESTYRLYNGGTMTITGGKYKANRSGDWESRGDEFVLNDGTLTVTNSEITNGTNYYQINTILLRNSSNATFNNTTIKENVTDSHGNGPLIKITNSATLTMNNSNVTSSTYSAWSTNETSFSTIKLEGTGNVSLNNTNVNATFTSIYRTNSSTLTIDGGSVTAEKHSALYNTGAGTITIGTLGGTVSKTNPAITGKTYGLYNSNSNAIINFYDGIFSGSTAIEGIIESVEPNYEIIEEIDQDSVQHKYLDRLPIVINRTKVDALGDNPPEEQVNLYKYYTIQDGIDASDPGDRLELLRNMSNTDTTTTITVGNTKNVTLDLMSYEITQNNDTFITNNGTFTITASDDNGIIKTNNGDIFLNNGTLNIVGGTLKSLESEIITNNGILNISGGTLYGSKNDVVGNDVEKYFITNNETGIINITGGDISFSGTGAVIKNKNKVTVSDINLHLYGGMYGSQGYYPILNTTFINSTESTSETTITGGQYGDSGIYGILLKNNGTARIEGITSHFYGTVSNTGTLDMIDVIMDSIYYYSNNRNIYESIYNDGTMNIIRGSYTNKNALNGILYNIGTLTVTDSDLLGINANNNDANQVVFLGNSSSTTITNTTITNNNANNYYNHGLILVQDGANLTINNSEIVNASKDNSNNSHSTISFTGTGIVNLNNTDISSTTVKAISKTGSGTLNINGGDIISEGNIGLYNTSDGIINIGTLGGTVSTTKPNIKGSTYGLYNSNNNATINFYDGIFTGETATYGPITEVEPNYEIINNQNQDGTYSKYLSRVLLIKNSRTNQEFYDIQDAIDSQNTINGDTLELLRDYTNLSSYSTIVVGSTKEIVLDLKGFSIAQNNSTFISNNGILTIKSSVDGGSIGSNGGIIFENNGTLNIESGDYYSLETQIITNNGAMNISGGKLYTRKTDNTNTNNGYNLIENTNSGTINITNGEFRFIGDGAVILNKNIVRVDNAKVNLYGAYYYYYNQNYYTAFINSTESTSETYIYGGTYGDTNSYGILLKNNGTAIVSGVTCDFKGSIYNTGTLNMTDVNMEHISHNNLNSVVEYIYNSGTLNILRGTYTATPRSYLFINDGSLSIDSASITANSSGVFNLRNSSYTTLTSVIINSLDSGTSPSFDIENNSNLTINSSSITHTTTYSDMSYTKAMEFGGSGQVNINNTDITGSHSRVIKKTNSGTLNITGGTISSDSGDVIVNSGSGSININSTLESTGGSAINNSGSGIITITDGSLKSNTTNAITTSAGTIIIGTSGGVPSTTIPSIYGKTYGLYNSGVQDNIYFYDGVIKGETGSIYGTITDTEGGYKEKRDNVTDPITGITTVDSTLTVVGSEEKVAVVNNINFLSIQSAVNYASNNGIEAITLYKSITLEDNLIKPAGGSNVKIYLNNYTITQGSYTIDSGIDLVAGTPPTGASLSRFLANISGDELNVKNIVLFEMDDGSSLEASKIYKLYRLVDGRQKLVKVKENNIGNYNIGNDSNDLRTIDGKIYINDIGEGEYKLIGSDSKEITFTVSYEGVSNNIRINNKANTRRVVDAVATLILTLQTGVVRSPYILIIMLLVLGILCFIAYGKYKEQHNKE